MIILTFDYMGAHGGDYIGGRSSITCPTSMTSASSRPLAVITGASSGIGLAIAQRLASEGYDLALCARRQERLEALALELQQQGATVFTQAVDLRDEAQILRFFAAIEQRFSRLDVLVNSAGLGHKEPLMTGATEAWQEMLEVNVLALCVCTREAIARMKTETYPNGSGNIIHLGSMAGHRIPTAVVGLHSATKFAVRSLTETLRRELRQADSAIRISSLSPGIVETEFAEKYSKSAEEAAANYARHPMLQADDIADAVAYLLRQPAHVEVHDILLRPTQQQS